MYPPHHFGGYEQAWQSAVGHLREQGHHVRVVTTDFRHAEMSDSGEPDVYRELRWYWRDHDFARFSPTDRLRIERHNHAVLRRHIRDLTPNIVSFWAMGGMSHSLIEAVRRRGLPMVAFVHDQWLDYGRHFDQWGRIFDHRRWLPAGLVERATGVPTHVDYARAGRYVFVSEFIRRKAMALRLGLADTAVAHSGIASVFLSRDAPHEWCWRLLHVGRLHPDKGIHDAVEALTQLPAEAALTFVGSWDPREEADLMRWIGEQGVSGRVQLLGHLQREQIAALYRDHDAVLFPVRWDEPWGLVPLEAMACGCPVVATGRGGSVEYLRDGENCVLVPARAPEAIAAAVHRLEQDPGLRERLREGGGRTAPLHTEAVFNAAVERHLAEVAGMPEGLPEPAMA